MRLLRSPGHRALILTLILWLYLATTLPTFDFDESLYRRVTESMRQSGNPWLLTCDGRELFHKPPVFYWLIWCASSLVDAGKTTVSAMAARIPSLLSSLGILFSLHAGMKYLFPDQKDRKPLLSPVFAFLSSAFAVLTGTAVILDPLQTLALMPALIIPARMFIREEPPARSHWLLTGASLALAACIKGLNGLVIPSFAIGIHLLLQLRSWGAKRVFKTALAFGLFAFIPAVLAASAFFLLLHQKIGPAFTREFFLVQHLGRGANPMEAHGGGILYHPLMVLAGGGFLTPLLIHLIHDRRPQFSRYGFPLTFALSFVLAFGFSATKLPHYTWPVWPALALFAGILETLPSLDRPLPRRAGFLAILPVLFTGSALLLLAIAPGILFEALAKDPVSTALIRHLTPFTFWQKSCFLAGSAACWIFQVRRSQIARSTAMTAMFSSIAVTGLAFGLAPGAKELLVQPFYGIAMSLKARHPPASSCIRYAGPYSATLSLALGPELSQGSCEPEKTQFLIVPEWKEQDCAPARFGMIARSSWLILCEALPVQHP